jgi:hypothetical protein
MHATKPGNVILNNRFSRVAPILALSFFHILSVTPAAADTCLDLAARNKAAQSGVALPEFQWAELAKKDVVFIGDMHTFSNPKDILQVTSQIKSSYTRETKACLFLEFPISISVKDLKDILNREDDDAETRKYKSYYKTILEGSEQSGFAVHLVDHKEYFKRNVTINERDRAMAENISALIKSGECDHGVMVVGKAHITVDESGRKMLRQNLSELGNTSTAINLQSVNEGLVPGQLMSWNGLCPSFAISLDHAVIFSNASIAGIALLPYFSPLTLIGYFEWTALFP